MRSLRRRLNERNLRERRGSFRPPPPSVYNSKSVFLITSLRCLLSILPCLLGARHLMCEKYCQRVHIPTTGGYGEGTGQSLSNVSRARDPGLITGLREQIGGPNIDIPRSAPPIQVRAPSTVVMPPTRRAPPFRSSLLSPIENNSFPRLQSGSLIPSASFIRVRSRFPRSCLTFDA